jgi:hypothetical protein
VFGGAVFRNRLCRESTHEPAAYGQNSAEGEQKYPVNVRDGCSKQYVFVGAALLIHAFKALWAFLFTPLLDKSHQLTGQHCLSIKEPSHGQMLIKGLKEGTHE